jgi:hypothetical protein
MAASRRFARCLVAACALAAVLSEPRDAAAQTTPAEEADLERLRKKFKEAMVLEEKNRWQDAHDVFSAIALEKQSAAVRYHIALCDENLGRLASALTGYEEALVMAARDGGDGVDKVIENSTARIAALEPRVPVLRVRIDPADEGVVSIDGLSVARDKLAEGVRVEVGMHKVTVRRGDKELPVAQLMLAERARELVEVLLPKKNEIKPPTLPPPEVPPTPAPEEGSSKVPAIVVGAVGLASLGGAAVFLALREVAIADVTATCTDEENLTGCAESARERAEEGQTYTYVSIGLAAGGAACLATATILWFVLDDADVPPKSPSTTPVVRVSPTLGGVVVHGEF